jgi:hypothetical protein
MKKSEDPPDDELHLILNCPNVRNPPNNRFHINGGGFALAPGIQPVIMGYFNSRSWS